MYERMNERMYVCMYVCMYACMYVRMYVCISRIVSYTWLQFIATSNRSSTEEFHQPLEGYVWSIEVIWSNLNQFNNDKA